MRLYVSSIIILLPLLFECEQKWIPKMKTVISSFYSCDVRDDTHIYHHYYHGYHT